MLEKYEKLNLDLKNLICNLHKNKLLKFVKFPKW